VAHTRPQPVEAEDLVFLQDGNEQYGHAVEAGAGQSVVNPEARIDVGRPRPVLVQIEPELLTGAVCVSRLNHQCERTVPGQHFASDAHGLEHESILHAALLRTGSVKRDDLELGILHGASGASERRAGRRAGPRRHMKDALHRHLVSSPGSLSGQMLTHRDARQGGDSALGGSDRLFARPFAAQPLITERRLLRPYCPAPRPHRPAIRGHTIDQMPEKVRL
jgi:hypothetical protein